jgi:hypothetical protein
LEEARLKGRSGGRRLGEEKERGRLGVRKTLEGSEI